MPNAMLMHNRNKQHLVTQKKILMAAKTHFGHAFIVFLILGFFRLDIHFVSYTQLGVGWGLMQNQSS